MNDTIVVAKISKLKIPKDFSIKIVGPKNTYYLYSTEILNTLEKLNEFISQLSVGNMPQKLVSRSGEYLISKNMKAETYLITSLDVDLSVDGEQLFDKIRKFFKPILSIFSLFLRDIFRINKIYFFKKKSQVYKFERLLEIPIRDREVSKTPQMIQFLPYRDVELIFPWILARLCKKEKFLSVIEEYLVGRIKSAHLGIEFMIYWNALEHLVNNFWDSKNKGGILNSKRVRIINKIIKKELESLRDSDINFKYLNISDINQKGLLLINNSPPIADKIISMCEKIHIKLTEDEKQIIRMINFLRNKLFHEEYYLYKLIRKFAKKFKFQEFQEKDFIEISQKFVLVLEKILLKFFKIVPNYFNLKISKGFENFHFLEWKKITLPSYLRNKKIKDKKISQRYGKKFTDLREHYLSEYNECKKDLLNNGKFIPLLKDIRNLESKINNYSKKSVIEGFIQTRLGRKKIYLKFKKDLKGKYMLIRKNDHTTYLGGFVITGSDFTNLKKRKYGDFTIYFKLYVSEETTSRKLNAKYLIVKGRFITLLKDIRNIG